MEVRHFFLVIPYRKAELLRVGNLGRLDPRLRGDDKGGGGMTNEKQAAGSKNQGVLRHEARVMRYGVYSSHFIRTI